MDSLLAVDLADHLALHFVAVHYPVEAIHGESDCDCLAGLAILKAHPMLSFILQTNAVQARCPREALKAVALIFRLRIDQLPHEANW